MFNESSSIDKYRNSVSAVTASKPRKIMEWSKNRENKLKKLFVVEKRSIHAIARMMGGREYEIAEALERFGFVQEPIKLAPKIYVNHGKKNYVPKWARKEEPVKKPDLEPVHEAPVNAEFREEQTDPRIDALERLMEQRDNYYEAVKALVQTDTSKMSTKEKVQHDIHCAKAREMYVWFSNSYDASLKKMASQTTEASKWTDNG